MSQTKAVTVICCLVMLFRDSCYTVWITEDSDAECSNPLSCCLALSDCWKTQQPWWLTTSIYSQDSYSMNSL